MASDEHQLDWLDILKESAAEANEIDNTFLDLASVLRERVIDRKPTDPPRIMVMLDDKHALELADLIETGVLATYEPKD